MQKYTIDPVYSKMFSLLLRRVFPTVMGKIPVFSLSPTSKSQRQHVEKTAQFTRHFHETKVLIVSKQTERLAVISRMAQRFF